MDAMRMVFEFIVNGWRKAIIKVMLSITVFSLIFITIVFYYGIYYGEKNCDAILKNGVKCSANLFVQTDANKLKNFVAKVKDVPGIEAIGNMVNYGSIYENMDEIKSIQAGHAKEYQITLLNQLEVKCINPELLPICEMRLSKGTEWHELEREEGVKYIYLGSAYESIPVGTRYEQSVGDDLVVAGIMKPGTHWISCDVLWADEASALATLNYVENMDYAVMVVTDNLLSNMFCLSCERDCDLNDVIERIRKEVDEGTEVYAETLTQIFQNGYKKAEIITEGMRKLLIICIFTGILILFSVHLIDMLDKAKNIGIFISQGYEQAYLQKVFFVRDLVLSILSVMAAYVITLCFSNLLFYGDSIRTIWQTFFWHEIVPVGLVLVFVVTSFCQLITTWYFKNNSISKLLNMIR